MAIEWRKDLETGVGQIDDQHRELFKRFNGLLDACNQGKGKDEVIKVLLFLDDYIRSHFAAEEELQRKIGYPSYESHRAQHAQFKDELAKLEKDFAENGGTMPLVIKMNQLVVSWLMEHIIKRDMDLAKFVKAS
ncbi:MAG TPA: bacteriohemerythrin [Verrucomicrobiae bacterium]|nr:bacteriohemerythrin [Verrucomicrobiae bacterium]